jgi:basic membrane protein A
MLKKNSRLFVLLLLLFTLLLVACGPGAGEEPAAGDEESVAEEAAPTEESMEEEAAPTEESMEEEAAAGDCSSDEVFCVGLVTDVGEVDDKSFNQSAWEGVQMAESELGGQVQFIETADAKDYAANIGLFADEGYDVIVTVGFALGQATIEAAAAYPDINFIGVDQFQAEAVPNVAGVIFPEDKAGFMAGALAAMLSESGTVAAVLGTDLVPPVVAFKEGYENGALYINPDINLISTYHPGGLDVAFTDPEWGPARPSKPLIRVRMLSLAPVARRVTAL